MFFLHQWCDDLGQLFGAANRPQNFRFQNEPRHRGQIVAGDSIDFIQQAIDLPASDLQGSQSRKAGLPAVESRAS